MRFCCNRIFSVLLLVAVLHAVVTANSARKPSDQTFRCFRSFSTISSFSAKAMEPRNNCRFSFIRVLDAGVDVRCTPEMEQVGGCYARVWLTGEPGLPSSADAARYTLELRALNDSVVRYKGMDGNGYGVFYPAT